MTKGIIFKGIGGFYYVKANGVLFECKARGKFKNQNITPLVGDYVLIDVYDAQANLATIEEVCERKNELLRPNVANVEQAIIVFAIKDPMPNLTLLDKMIVLAEHAGLEIIICFNKGDLDETFDFELYQKRFERTGYHLIKTCAHTGEGIDALKGLLKNKISVFSGPSGVGKSSLLNAIENGLSLTVGELSQKIKRGKHTTRHSELLQLSNGGIVVDTPGFTSLSMHEVEPEALSQFFPDFSSFKSNCRFDNCLHLNEPNCGVKEALVSGMLSKERYDVYVYLYKEMTENERKNKKW